MEGTRLGEGVTRGWGDLELERWGDAFPDFVIDNIPLTRKI